MRSEHSRMTMEEFKFLPRKLGWKYEYLQGETWITPGNQVVMVRADVKPHPTGEIPYPIRAPQVEDVPELTDTFIQAFGDTIEYCDREPAEIAVSAATALQDHFQGKRGTPHPASRIALDSGSIAGAALIVEGGPDRAVIDLLFVKPSIQRRGTAALLLSAVMNALHAAGVKILDSCYVLGNEASGAWHKRAGFVEQPAYLMALHHYRYFQHELWRHENLGDIPPIEHDRLAGQRDHWRDVVGQLVRERGWPETIIE